MNALTATDAYRVAYHCENMASTTITANASRLLNDSNIWGSPTSAEI